ncbi:MAG: phosphotransferase [Bacillota bacterium]|nr:phosphotransferase [Bacillota bacterium]
MTSRIRIRAADLSLPPIRSWSDWGRIHRDTELFRPLVRRVLECVADRALPDIDPAAGITACPPGTHAVFRAGRAVVKLYAPASSGIGSREAPVEWEAARLAAAAGVAVAAQLARGSLEIRGCTLDFAVTAALNAADWGCAFPRLPPAEQRAAARALRDLTSRLHAYHNGLAAIDLVARAGRNERWRRFTPAFNSERQAWLRARRQPAARADLARRSRLCHGDLTRDNCLIAREGEEIRLQLLDFGDALMAPPAYDQLLVLLELLPGHPHLWTEALDPLPAAAELVEAALLHNFAGDFLPQFFPGIEKLPGLEELGSFFNNWLARAAGTARP